MLLELDLLLVKAMYFKYHFLAFVLVE